MPGLFVKREKLLGSTFKSFRKSQDAKHQWNKNPWLMKMAVKDWHNSFEGKLFHRKLARYNVIHTLIPKGGLFGQREKNG